MVIKKCKLCGTKGKLHEFEYSHPLSFPTKEYTVLCENWKCDYSNTATSDPILMRYGTKRDAKKAWNKFNKRR